MHACFDLGLDEISEKLYKEEYEMLVRERKKVKTSKGAILLVLMQCILRKIESMLLSEA